MPMWLTSLWRSLRVVEHLATGILIAVFISLRTRFDQPPPWVPRAVSWWQRRLCRALGVRLRVEGRIEPGCLLIGNHISWLDIPIVGTQGEIGFLAKSDVRGWPLIGWMTEIAGTRFIARGGHQTGDIAASLVADVAGGRPMMIFPEGTTTDGRTVGHFHSRLFRIAQGSGIRIQPVAIRYRAGEDPTPDHRVPYVGEDTLIANLWRLVRHPDLVACVQFLPPIAATEGDSRRALAEQARSAIVDALALNPRGAAQSVPGAAAANCLEPQPVLT